MDALLPQLGEHAVEPPVHRLEPPARLLPQRPNLLEQLQELLPGREGLQHEAPELVTHLRVLPQEARQLGPEALEQVLIRHRSPRPGRRDAIAVTVDPWPQSTQARLRWQAAGAVCIMRIRPMEPRISASALPRGDVLRRVRPRRDPLVVERNGATATRWRPS